MPHAASATLLAVLALATLASAAAFVALGLDKLAAARGTRRVPERVLHTLELLGGWPGALVARRLFRHKTVKAAYRRAAAAMACLHVLLAGLLVGAAAALLP